MLRRRPAPCVPNAKAAGRAAATSGETPRQPGHQRRHPAVQRFPLVIPAPMPVTGWAPDGSGAEVCLQALEKGRKSGAHQHRGARLRCRAAAPLLNMYKAGFGNAAAEPPDLLRLAVDCRNRPCPSSFAGGCRDRHSVSHPAWWSARRGCWHTSGRQADRHQPGGCLPVRECGPAAHQTPWPPHLRRYSQVA